MLLYTTDREGSLKEGMTIELSKNTSYNVHCIEIEDLVTLEELEKHADELFPNGLSHHGHKYLKDRHTYGSYPHFQINNSILSEMNLEYVRKLYYPDLPSRFQSMFASESIEQAKWFRNNYGRPHNKIYEIEATSFHRVDMKYIYLGVQNVGGSYFAHQYWQGKSSPTPYWEYIVPLPSKVIRSIDEF